ncbi:hypothetical protein WG66_002410 [Moniliophthora roreri]|nr:hypothetical protein WG66_002410 [Moniliophthora roreri]
MMIEISTAVLEEMEKKKNKGSKVATPDPFEGDRKDTKRFLMETKIYLRMHPTEYDNDEKKCLFLLSYLRGKNTESWKNGQSAKIFEPKSGATPLTFQTLKDEFKKHYLPADIQAEAQIRIEEAKMTDRADNYVNDFQVMADESRYGDQALIHIFRKRLPNSLSAKILNQPQGRPADLEGCLPDTPSGITAFADDITHTGPFHPSPFELLFLVNTGGHDDTLRNASVGQPHLQYAIDGLIRLRAQCVSLNAIIEETNVYPANLVFNAVAAGPAPLILQGPITVPPLPPHSDPFEPQLSIPTPPLGSFSTDVCDTDPNSPEFLRATATYNARIRAAVELARDQHNFCPRYTQTEPVLPRQADPSAVVPKLESPASPDPIKSEPDSNASSDLVYPSDSSSRDSSPIYAQSIGVATASPSPTPGPSSPKPQPESPPAPAPSDPFNPFDVNDEPLAPSTVPFLASGQFNPAFVSIRDIAHANPGVPLDARTYTNTWVEPASVWDDETVSETPEQAERRATVEEVHEFLCALCAEWRTTAPNTVRAIVARSADYLHLGIYLGIVVSDEGHIGFLERTIPGAHGLLTTISMGVTTTMTSTETENSNGQEAGEVTDPDDLVPMFVGIPDHGPQDVTLLDGRVVQVVRMGSAM